jgi:hypothetical protein
MTFPGSNSSQKSAWSSPSAEWLRQRDTIVIESHKLSFSSSPESKHTATCNGADELAFGDLGRCSGSL